MTKTSDKLQQRATLMSILNKYRNVDKIDNAQLKEDVDIIATISNKSFVCKTLFQEIKDSKSIFSNICAIIALETIDNETFEKEVIECLKNSETKDDKKFFMMSLLKQKDISFNFRDVAQYIDAPEELAHNGIVDFLSNAINDPEVQIDLLDFYLNIPKNEKTGFLDNLLNEFDDDSIANAFSILVHTNPEIEQLEIILNGLLNSKSAYAIEGLEYILENNALETKIKAKIKKQLKFLKEKFKNFENDILTKNSKIHKCYISFVDGNSNFSLIASRIQSSGAIDAFLTTINIKSGIVSCMGFGSITDENFNSIVKRLFCDSIPININAIALKSLYEYYREKSQKNNIDLPYELSVWEKILNGIRTINYDIAEFINSKLETINLTESKVKKLLSSKILETWYYSVGQNEYVDKIIEQIEKEHITDLDKINEIVSKSINDNFISNKEYMAELQSRLLLQAYVASLAKLKMTSACAYSLCFKNPYLKMFITSSIDKSLYYALSTKAYELEEKNVFKKSKPTNFTKDELELIMAQLEEKWS